MENFPVFDNVPEATTHPEVKKEKGSVVGKFLKAAAFGFAIGNSAPTFADTSNNFEKSLPESENHVLVETSKRNSDPYLLVMQQKIRDLQESGEMKIENAEQKARGVRFHTDPGYDPVLDHNVPGLGDASDMQKVMTENATREQIQNLEEYKKDKVAWDKKMKQEIEEEK